jgi:anti-sigma regulatory factor (Ser/Thr protein kinase)
LTDQAAVCGGVRHAAWFYRTTGEMQSAVEDFAADAQKRGEPLLVALPASDHDESWRPSAGALVTAVDMRQLGANPARIIATVKAFAERHSGRAINYLSQCSWPARPGAELLEAARNDALLNVAFEDSAQIRILCLYDHAALPEAVLADAAGSHPWLRSAAGEHINAGYLGRGELPSSLGKPLSAPAGAQALGYEHDLRPVRALVLQIARQAGLSSSRCTDLMIAANEVAANTLRHTGAGGIVRLWCTDSELLCQFEDTGHITDPLAGHLRPAVDLPGGHGLWLVNQVCDLAEIRTSAAGTTIRLHMSLTPDGAYGPVDGIR